MSQKHGASLRGLMTTGGSPRAAGQGKFGRMFRRLPAASFGGTDGRNERHLAALAAAMTAPDDDLPKDGRDDEESAIPALYTYFGQFIDHDITFDPASSLQQQNDPDALLDFRTPALDLDNVYGRGPADQPYLYAGDNRLFLGSAPLHGGAAGITDLPRNSADPARALIGDPRNDENVIVSQLQGLFLRFHNRMVDADPVADFATVARRVRFHYQYLVVNDFLPRLVDPQVLRSLQSGHRYVPERIAFFPWQDPFMPVEFSVAAYRLGHSMVRPGYRLNDNVLQPIFPLPAQGFPDGLTGFRAMNPAWGIDWGRFIDVDIRHYDGTPAQQQKRLQLAYRIDTTISNPLAQLPPSIASNPSSLAERNLLRGWRLGLPSGQRVAAAMHAPVLSDAQILIGPDAQPITSVSSAFERNCPLWTYVLAEAMQHSSAVPVPVVEPGTKIDTPRLGPVGGRIVAEVLLGLLFADRSSYLNINPGWTPAGGPNYTLKDFVKFALGN